ncbi:TonB-dependent receptor [Thalassotalea euphylliae]|uniref:TonB-dependent receptor n=1 Tax=Thalassotalea euphylliae TaxID=1655234 RepID=UPI00362EDC60
MKFNKVMIALAINSAVIANAMAQNISGKVVDAQGNPIANAEIHVENVKTRVLTDENGQFSITDVAKGPVELHVKADNYSHYHEDVVVSDSDVTGLSITLAPTVMEIIDIHATPLHSSAIESALPINVLAADELRMKQASTLGETLKNEVGVHSSYYGPVSSTPIIRGMDGPRVMVTQNGLDVGDASRVGADHIVSTEAATATQIEVLRGPATLFYGSGAIGGVVNVVDNRVPTSTDTTFDYLAQHSSVSDEDEASFALNTGSGNFALYLDGFWRESNDYDIPGYAEAHDEHHDEHEEDHDEHEGEEHEEHEEEGVKGTLENSASKSSGFTIGTSYILDNGFVGFSYGRLDREYGIPGHSHGHGEEEHDEHEGEEHDEHEEHEEEGVYGDLEQDRFQMLSDLYFEDKFLNRLATKFAYTDYQHQEVEEGEVGTTFKNESYEARADLYHADWNGWNGAWTLHYKHSDFEATGEEAFTPPSETSTLALAWLEETHLSEDVLLQLGARIEYVELKPNGMAEEHHDDEHEDEHHDEHEEGEEHDEHEDEHLALDDQDFTPVSASVGIVWDYEPGYNLGFSAAFSQRAPSAAELFSNGPHIGTNTFEVGALYEIHEHGDHVDIEIGDQDVDLETSYNLDVTWRKFEGDFGFIVSAFYNHIEDYYYQQDTGFVMEDGHDHGDEHEHEDEHMEEMEDEHGHEEEGLSLFIYQQDDVDMYGVEAEFVYQISAPLKMTVFGDYIRAELSDGGNIPRIPPMRIGSQFNYVNNQIAAELAVSYYFKQDDVAEFETETDSYTMVDANFNYFIDGIGSDMAIFVKGNNLTDEEARVHSSFLKNDAPLPGRNITVGIRGSF